MRRSPIILPSPIQSRLESAVQDFLYAESGSRIEFSRPKGEPALTTPDSMSWQVFRNPVSLFVGGVAAVILELAEPRVRTGVWENTSFRNDPLRRLQRTGLAAMTTVYGPRSQCEAMIAAINGRHRCISGTTPSGQAYRASDPELLCWVHATAAFGFLEAHSAYVRTADAAGRDRFYCEGVCASALYGAVGAPTSQAGINALFAATHARLEPSPIVFEFLDIVQRVPLFPRPFSMVQRWLVKAAVQIVPEPIRERLHLGGQWDMTGLQYRAVRYAANVADRVLLRSSPMVQACRRVGLPDDYLYRASNR